MKLLCVVLLGLFAASAQAPSFEVASIKPNRGGDGPSSTRAGAGQLTMENVSLRKLTLMAYGIPDDRSYALAGPDWLATEAFNIVAKYPSNTPQDQIRAMLQNLLADRFHLRLHREARPLPQYVLVVARGGPKIQPVQPGNPGTNGRAGRLEATRITMQKLADVFAKMVGMPVVNETGLEGVYTFNLEWTPDKTEIGRETGPSLFSALQDQLGLKLEGRKGPVEVLVIDHIDRTPTEN
jgi:uncharacterized protein (TIGR03435 family)